MKNITPLEKKYHIKTIQLMLEAANEGIAIQAELHADKYQAVPVMSIAECEISKLVGFKHQLETSLDSLTAGDIITDKVKPTVKKKK
jgi:hypothetical protein